MVVKNGHGFFGLGTLKSALSQDWIDEMSWFFECWYKLRKVNSGFDNYWQGIVKNGWGLMDHGTLKSGVSHRWFDELSRFIERFLHVDSDGIIFWFDDHSTLYLWHLKAGGPLQLYIARILRKNSLCAKVTPK